MENKLELVGGERTRRIDYNLYEVTSFFHVFFLCFFFYFFFFLLTKSFYKFADDVVNGTGKVICMQGQCRDRLKLFSFLDVCCCSGTHWFGHENLQLQLLVAISY